MGKHTYWNPRNLLVVLWKTNEVEGILERTRGFGLGVGGKEN